MEWTTIESIITPDTNTGFIVIESLEKFRLIIWYKEDYFIPVGSVFVPTKFGVMVNETIRTINIIHIFPYNSELWSLLSSRGDCSDKDLTGVVAITKIRPFEKLPI